MITQNYTVVDLETGSLPAQQVEKFKPEFRPGANLKDIAKIQAQILEKEQAWREGLALDPVTGQILCIGLLDDEGFDHLENASEKALLEYFVAWMADEIHSGRQIVGFYIRTFDAPYVIRRAWSYGIKVSDCLFEGRYLSSQIVDVAERWACGGREPRDRISLDNLSKFLGTGAKNGKGEDFAGLWATDKAKALEYLKNDLVLCKAAYERLYA